VHIATTYDPYAMITEHEPLVYNRNQKLDFLPNSSNAVNARTRMVCSKQTRSEKCKMRKTKRKDCLRNLGVDERIILN
jgi:hypothetical protein